MKTEQINATLKVDRPAMFFVQSYDARDRRLTVAFTFDGGPHEDEIFVVEFYNTILFHLPSILFATVLFRVASEDESKRLIPSVSYDSDEVSGKPGGYTVFVLENHKGVAYGYYLAAESVHAKWIPKNEGLPQVL